MSNKKVTVCLACGKDKPDRENVDFCLNCTIILADYIKANNYLRSKYPDGISLNPFGFKKQKLEGSKIWQEIKDIEDKDNNELP